MRLTAAQLRDFLARNPGNDEARAAAMPPARRRAQPRQREHALQVAVVRLIRPLLSRIGGKLILIGGEIRAGRGGKESQGRFARMQRERALAGYEVGQPDLLAAWPPGQVLFVELKAPAEKGLFGAMAPAGAQRRSQRDFEAWCEAAGLGYAVCRSPDDVYDALHAHGAPLPPAPWRPR